MSRLVLDFVQDEGLAQRSVCNALAGVPLGPAELPPTSL